MKKFCKQFCLVSGVLIQANFLPAQKVTFEDIKQQCSTLPYDKRVNLSVSNFNVATLSNPGQFGDELAQMLTNALQGVNCFNVRLSIKDMKAIQDEQQFEQAGNTEAGTGNSPGKIKAAQVIVMGKVTEYSAGEKKFQVLGVGGSGGNKAHVGFIIQLINATTGLLIDSKSINVEGKTSGFSGAQVFGVNVAGGTNNKSLQDACEKAIKQAVEFIASKKDDMPLPDPVSAVSKQNSYNASNCPVLRSSYIPKIMVIVSEYHMTRIISDPAGETEINRKLTEAGFRVVDPSMYAAIKHTRQFAEASKDARKAVSISKKFGADIVIYGEAFSQLGGLLNGSQVSGVQNGNQVSCRARVEVRAVRTDDAGLIATNGLEAGAVDNAETIASKSAIRSAASLVADYLLGQLCGKNFVFSKSGVKTNASSEGKSVTEINMVNADYSKLRTLADALAAKGTVLEKSIKDGKGYIKFEHKGSSDSIADFINDSLGSKFSISNAVSGSITLEAK